MRWFSSQTPAMVLSVMVVLGGSSCQKLKDLQQKLSSYGESESEKEVTGLAITKEQLESSDAAVDEYVKVWEKLSKLLVKVRDEKSAFEARKQMDLLALELREASKRTIEVRDQEDLKRVIVANKDYDSKSKGKKRVKELDATVYWYVLAENADAYDRRMLASVQATLVHIQRITRRMEEDPVVVDIVHSGVLGMLQVDENLGGKEEKKGAIQPMPKDWLPPGVTRE